MLGSQPDHLKWAVRVMSPHDISRHMLQRTPYNLCVGTPENHCASFRCRAAGLCASNVELTCDSNAQSHDATAMLIREVLSKGFNVTECFVDTVGPSQAYQEKLEKLFPNISCVAPTLLR